MSAHGRGPILLSRYLALAWLGLIVYGSLHPFSGWRDSGASPIAFLDAGWPRYWTVFDLLANVAIYLPLGFFLTLAFSRLPGRITGAILAILLAGGVSFCLESIQTWLPSRVPSNLDLACNTLGGLIGAAWATWVGPRILTRLLALEHLLIAPVPHAELGLTLIGLWLLVPLSLALCLAIATLAATILVGPSEALAWLTPGAQLGLAVGIGILAPAMALPATARLMLAALAMLAGTVLVNMAPPNPYSAAALATWQQGHFLNFNGLTRLVATLWPFLTLPFLFLTARRI